MWWISIITGLIITWTVLPMALGFGAIYSDFKAENRAATVKIAGLKDELLALTQLNKEKEKEVRTRISKVATTDIQSVLDKQLSDAEIERQAQL